MKYKKGTKVIPNDKTAGEGGLNNSVIWKCRPKNQPYLFITGYDYEENAYVLQNKPNLSGGDFFNESDLTLYGKKMTLKQLIGDNK